MEAHMPEVKNTPDMEKPRKRAMVIAEDVAESLSRSATDGKVGPLAISSELPYLRSGWLGDSYYEVLDHSPGAIVMDRLNDGAALLFNHDSDKHLGVIENPSIGKDRVLRGMPTFGESELAKEKKRDVQNRTLRWTSVQYRVLEQVLEKESKKGPSTYRVTKWEPLEVSLVTIPADPSVGVGRSADGEDFNPELLAKQFQEMTEKLEQSDVKVAEAEQRASESLAKVADLEKSNEVLRLSNEKLQREVKDAQDSAAAEENRHAELMQRTKEELEQSAKACQDASQALDVAHSRANLLSEIYEEMGARMKEALDSSNGQSEGIAAIRSEVEGAYRGVKSVVADFGRRLLLRSLN
jgi:phage head maturation protease